MPSGVKRERCFSSHSEEQMLARRRRVSDDSSTRWEEDAAKFSSSSSEQILADWSETDSLAPLDPFIESVSLDDVDLEDWGWFTDGTEEAENKKHAEEAKNGLVQRDAVATIARRLKLLPSDVYGKIAAAFLSSFRSPIAVVSFTNYDRRWVAGDDGVLQAAMQRHRIASKRSPSRLGVFCERTIEYFNRSEGHVEALEMTDLANHPVFRAHPLVTGAPHIDYYAGAIVRIPDSASPGGCPKAIGACCIFGVENRTRAHGLTAAESARLLAFARDASTLIEISGMADEFDFGDLDSLAAQHTIDPQGDDDAFTPSSREFLDLVRGAAQARVPSC